MAKKEEIIDQLKTKFKLDVDKLLAALAATEETDYELPEVTVLATADLTTRDENMKQAGKKEGETIGETKGKELAAKAFRKKFTLDDTIGNDIDKVVDAVNAKLNKGDAGLQEQIQALIKDKETLTNEKTALMTKAEQASFDAQLISMFPASRTADLKDAERLLLLKNDLQFEKDADGKIVVKKNGQIVADPGTHAPLALDKVITDHFTERKWTGQAEGGAVGGGRGGGNSGAGAGGGTDGIKSLSKFTEKWKAENPGKNEISPDFDAALAAHAKVNTDFNMNE